MKNTVKSMQLELLSYILADIETFAELDPLTLCSQDYYVQSMLHIGVPFTPTLWRQGRVDPARKMAFLRAVRKLEKRGLVSRITEPQRDRTRHLIPTLDGLCTAIRHQRGKVDLAAVCAGLDRTVWGKSLATQLATELDCDVSN